MELKTFVAQSLTEIIEGVKEAQSVTKTTGAVVSPSGLMWSGGENPKPLHTKNPNTPLVDLFEFDVAVTVTSEAAKEGKGGIKVAFVNIGGGVETSESASSISRIKFSVPVILPMLDPHNPS